uniref:Putative group i salivary lipocalin n=1 Tax=Rhipicephalus pulchellus TaxID=72859 RepID=L7LRP3_RHIPC
MSKKQLLATFVLFSCVTMFECQRWPWKDARNIRKFVNTTAPVWTYLTSEMTNIECKVDEYIFMTAESVQFLRSYYRERENFSYRFLAKFDSQQKKRMIISSPGGTVKQTEDIVYMSNDLTCAVVKVTTSAKGFQKTYDLRIRDSGIQVLPQSKCVEHFRLKAGRQGHLLYRDYCRNFRRS